MFASCRYVHYEVDKAFSDEYKNSLRNQNLEFNGTVKKKIAGQESTILYPPQWIQCDLRYFDTSILGEPVFLVFFTLKSEFLAPTYILEESRNRPV